MSWGRKIQAIICHKPTAFILRLCTSLLFLPLLFVGFSTFIFMVSRFVCGSGSNHNVVRISLVSNAQKSAIMAQRVYVPFCELPPLRDLFVETSFPIPLPFGRWRKGQKCSEVLVLVAGTSFFFSCVSPAYTALCTLRTWYIQYSTVPCNTVRTVGILLLVERNPHAQKVGQQYTGADYRTPMIFHATNHSMIH